MSISRLLTYEQDGDKYLLYLEYMRKKYGITREQWEDQLDKQARKCAICGRGNMRLLPDHDHKTRKFRGALCYYCNGILGKIARHPIILINIRKYLRRNGC